MTRTTNARIAGYTFLVYIAAGVAGMALAAGALLSVVLSLLMCFSALVLGVTLYAITRDEDREIAMLGLTCRVVEGVLGAMFIPARLALVSLGSAAANGPDGAATQAVAEFIMKARGLNIIMGATFFAAGSALFSGLFVRGRMIPLGLAWLGVLASVLLVVGLPLQLAGVIRGSVTQLMWLPMAAFEIPLGLWLIVKGVATSMPLPARR